MTINLVLTIDPVTDEMAIVLMGYFAGGYYPDIAVSPPQYKDAGGGNWTVDLPLSAGDWVGEADSEYLALLTDVIPPPPSGGTLADITTAQGLFGNEKLPIIIQQDPDALVGHVTSGESGFNYLQKIK